MPGSVSVDVVDLRRIERLYADHGPVLERRLLHPLERTRLATQDAAGRARRLAAALAAKEAWIKSCSRRPAGWAFDHAEFAPAGGEALPADVQELVARFADDLQVTAVEAGRIGDRFAWYGIHDRWLIAAVLQ